MTRCLCRCGTCASVTKESLDKAWEEAHDAYHASVKAGKGDPELSWKSYALGQLRSAYYLYVDTLEETK